MGGRSLIVKRGDRTKSGIKDMDNSIAFTENDLKSIKEIETLEFVSPITDVNGLTVQTDVTFTYTKTEATN